MYVIQFKPILCAKRLSASEGFAIVQSDQKK